jgi:hypothetical protein
VKKILFYFQQVGCANALLPLIEKWKSSYDIVITGRELVCNNLRKRAIKVYDYSELSFNNRINNNDSTWFKKFSPDIVITDTIDLTRVADGIVCRVFWQLARKYNIPSMAYVDCWWGYCKRFILPDEVKIPILPDHIVVIDELAQNDILNAGFPVEKILVLGSPKFEYLYKIARSNKKIQKSAARRNIGFKPDRFVILFVSQPIEKIFGRRSTLGFTEKTTLKALLEVFSDFPKYLKTTLSIIILLHPEEEENTLRNTVEKYSKDISVSFHKEDGTLNLLLAADLVVGMFSILLAEAVIVNKPVLSVQLNFGQQEILITNTIGATCSIKSHRHLYDELFQSVSSEKHRMFLKEKQQKFKVVTDAYDRWDKMIKSLLKVS